MKTRYLLWDCLDECPVAVFVSEKAAWAHVTFLGRNPGCFYVYELESYE